MKKLLGTALLATLLLNGCAIKHNWSSTQNKTQWNAKFNGFMGRESIAFAAKPNATLNLTSQLKAVEGNLRLKIDGTTLPIDSSVQQHQFRLDNGLKLTMIGKKAKGSFSLKYEVVNGK